MRRFFSHEAPVVGAETVIAGQDARHIARVLRLKPGDEVVLLSGDGREFLARIARIDAGNVAVTVLSERVSDADPSIELTVCLGFLKDKKMDDLVRQMTELGMSGFQPFLARRSVSRPDPSRMASRIGRWEKIARESIKQCRRGAVPEIRPVVSLDEALRLSEGDDVKILFYENETGPNSFPRSRSAVADAPLKVTIMLGPEGGFTDDEVAAARRAGFDILSMGPRILKAETAAVAACTLVQYVYGDMGGERSEVRGQRPEVGGRRSEVGGRRSEVRGQRSEVGGRRSEVRGRKSEGRGQGERNEGLIRLRFNSAWARDRKRRRTADCEKRSKGFLFIQSRSPVLFELPTRLAVKRPSVSDIFSHFVMPWAGGFCLSDL